MFCESCLFGCESSVACEKPDQDYQRSTASDPDKSNHCIASLCSEYPTSLLESVWKEARTRAEEAVADARKTLSATGLNVCDCEATPVGEPRAFILDEAKAWGADLIVLGSHGRHGWDRLLMGSVAESVALHAHCSVEVIRR